MEYFLISSLDTGRKYKRKKLKSKYKNIKNGKIQKVYEIKRNVGIISDGIVYKNKKGE